MTSRDEIVRADKRRVWHPYTRMRGWVDEAQPLVIDRAEGAWLVDRDGKRFLDGNSSWWVACLGHGHPRLLAALETQARRMAHVSLAGITHEPAAMLAEELVAVAPRGLERVFYSDDGSTAVEVAIKLALQVWHERGQVGRRRFVALEGAFHGETIGATSLGGVQLFRRPFAGALIDCIHVPIDDGGDALAFGALERVLADQGPSIAAVVLEPRLLGAGGMRMYAAEHLARARALCDAHDVLLVLDEVFTGYGRTGPMWACESAGVTPDMLCLAKGMTGGMLPMAATLVSASLFDALADSTFFYGHSYCGNPLGASVAREVLRVYRDEEVLARAAPKADRIAKAFEEMGRIDGTFRARALGMVGAIDLSPDASYGGDLGWKVYAEALRRGAYVRPLGDVVYVAPPINVPDADLELLLDAVAESIRAIDRRDRR